MNTTSCRLRNAQCERIGNYCICHCFREYTVLNGSCLKGMLYKCILKGHIENCHDVVCEFKEVCYTSGKLESV